MPYIFDEHQSTQNTYFDIARGHYSNVTPVNLFGFNRSVATSYETIFNDGGGLYTFPSSSLTMSLVSSSAADTMQVLIEGLNASWEKITDTVTLNGTTAVTTNIPFFRINSAQILSGSNVGNITVSNGGTTYAYIEAGTGICQSVVYSVPAGCKLYINSVAFASGTVNPNKYLTGRAKLTTSNGADLAFWNSTWAVGFMQFNIPVPFTVPEKCDFSIEAKSSSGENEISCYINAHLVDDE